MILGVGMSDSDIFESLSGIGGGVIVGIVVGVLVGFGVFVVLVFFCFCKCRWDWKFGNRWDGDGY